MSARIDVVQQPDPPGWPRLIVAGCVAAGMALRLLAYLRNPSLWIDEAMLALNVVGRDIGGMFAPLDWNQGAPVGYLLLAKVCHFVGGSSEFALRLPSVLAALASHAVFIPLAYRVLPLVAARYAVV